VPPGNLAGSSAPRVIGTPPSPPDRWRPAPAKGSAPGRVEHLLADERVRAIVSMGSPGDDSDAITLRQDYAVAKAGRPLPFASLIHTLNLGVRNLQPDDPEAYPLASEAVLTVSGMDAEIILSPIPLAPGFAAAVTKAADAERLALARRLGPEHSVAGVSTRFGLPAHTPAVDRVATEFISRFAAPLMLLLDQADSPGLLVRPDPGLIELSTAYASGSQLAAALIFAAAAVRRCVAMTHDRAPDSESDGGDDDYGSIMAPPLQSEVVPSSAGSGWFVTPTAFGHDLRAAGRHVALRTLDSMPLSGQEVLEKAWTYARPLAVAYTTLEELKLVDSLVAGDLPLPLEGAIDESRMTWANGAITLDGRPAVRGMRTGGEARHGDWRRPRRSEAAKLELAPVMVTWDTVVYIVVDDARRKRAFAVVPRRLLGTWLRLLAGGELDGPLSRYLHFSRGDRVLSSYAQTLTPGLYDSLPSRRALLFRERYGPEPVEFPAV